MRMMERAQGDLEAQAANVRQPFEDRAQMPTLKLPQQNGSAPTPLRELELATPRTAAAIGAGRGG